MQVFSHSVIPQQTAATGSTEDSSSGTAGTNTATVTANDFLQLLVTEMQNQDPTAQTDPNEYIDQLVQVNSLEQLVQINQDLSGLSTSSGSSSGSTHARGTAATGNPPATPQTTIAVGNLSAAAPGSGSALRVANALGSATQILAPGTQASPTSSMLAALKQRARAQSSPSSPAH